MKTFIALDDEPLALKLIEKLASEVADWKLLRTFTDAEQAAAFLTNHPVDLLLCDIHMPDISGLQFVSQLTQPTPMVIFVTAYQEHALEGFNLDVVDYLLKPVAPDRFEKALKKAGNLLDLRHLAAETGTQRPVGPEFFEVFSEYQQVRIKVRDVLYMESMGDYVKIFLSTQQKPVLTLNRLKNLAELLQNTPIVRIHRSYLIHREKISARQKHRVCIDTVWLPVGEKYQDILDITES